MEGFNRLLSGDIRAIVAVSAMIAACILNHVLADSIGYDWEWGTVVLTLAAVTLSKRI